MGKQKKVRHKIKKSKRPASASVVIAVEGEDDIEEVVDDVPEVVKPKKDKAPKPVPVEQPVAEEKKPAGRPAKGSKENPWPLFGKYGPVDVTEAKPGYWSGVYIEVLMQTGKGKHVWEFYVSCTSKAAAEKELRAIKKRHLAQLKSDAQRDYELDNPVGQTAAQAHLKVTKKLSDKKIAEYAEELKATRDRLRANVTPPPFKWEPPKDFDKGYRIIERLVHIADKEVKS